MSVLLEVEGDFACFTRPEMRVERVSYEVPTPSACRNILQSILWKPGMEWYVDSIEIMNPISWMTICRNEVGAVASMHNAKRAMRCGTTEQFYIYVEDERQPRSSLILRDVHYRISAHFQLTEKAGKGDTPQKFHSMFLRRARQGQCFRQPYLGCREFPADFRIIEPGVPITPPISETRPLGWMFYDYDYTENPPAPMFFNAHMENGVVRIPPASSEEIHR